MKSLKYAKQIVQTLIDAGYLAYFAGGWVRDYLMEHPSSDVDIATDADPATIIKLFPRTVHVGISFGVIVVVMDGHNYEVATFRQDVDYEDGRRPNEISFSTPFEDAQRRDFTINGMFFDPFKEKVIDFVNGQKDIEHKIIRTIGEPHERFREDRLRMIRAVRFATRFDFSMDPMTERAIIDYAKTLFPAVALERVWQELKKMAEGPRFEKGVLWLHKLGLLEVIFPQLEGFFEGEIHDYLKPLARYPEDAPAILRVMTLFPDMQVKEKVELCRYLKVRNRDIKAVELAHYVRELARAGKKVEDVEWVRVYAEPTVEMNLKVVSAGMEERDGIQFLEEHQKRQARLKPHVIRIQQKMPLVNAAMLKKEGIVAGKGLGRLLNEAESLVVNSDLHDPEKVIQQLKTSPHWPS